MQKFSKETKMMMFFTAGFFLVSILNWNLVGSLHPAFRLILLLEPIATGAYTFFVAKEEIRSSEHTQESNDYLLQSKIENDFKQDYGKDMNFNNRYEASKVNDTWYDVMDDFNNCFQPKYDTSENDFIQNNISGPVKIKK